MFCEATEPRVLGLPMEYSLNQVLPESECGPGKRKGEGKAEEEKAGQALEEAGLGRARGCCTSWQEVGQFSPNGHCCSCRLHPANATTVGWDWTLLKCIMEDKVLGTTCHIEQGSSSIECLRVSIAQGFTWQCSAPEWFAAAKGSSCQLGIRHLSHLAAAQLSSAEGTATDKASGSQP